MTASRWVSPPERMRGLHRFQTLIAADDADGTVYAFAF